MSLSLSDWLNLWYAGRQDGRRDLPAWYTGGELPPMTPQLVAIANQAQAWFEVERVQLVRATRDVAQRRSQLEDRISTLSRQLERLTQPGVAPTPLGDRELQARRLGESGEDVDVATVRARRECEYGQAREAYDRRLQQIHEALDTAQAQLAELSDELDQHQQYALARVTELQHLAGQRAAIYCRALVRRHAKGPALASVWRRWLPELPSWAAEVESRVL
jgi:hypothetical protein